MEENIFLDLSLETGLGLRGLKSALSIQRDFSQAESQGGALGINTHCNSGGGWGDRPEGRSELETGTGFLRGGYLTQAELLTLE